MCGYLASRKSLEIILWIRIQTFNLTANPVEREIIELKRALVVSQKNVTNMCRKFEVTPKLRSLFIQKVVVSYQPQPNVRISKMKLYVCEGDPNVDFNGWDCDSAIPRKCKDLAWTWSNSKNNEQVFPEPLGIQIRGQFLMTAITYHRSSTEHIIDASGLMITVSNIPHTPTSLMLTGIEEPTGHNDGVFTSMTECSSFCTDLLIPQSGIDIFGYQIDRDYRLGGSVRSTIVRANGTEDVIFDIAKFSQGSLKWTNVSIRLHKGDKIITNCTHPDSDDVSVEDDCFVYLSYYPALPNPFVPCFNVDEIETCGSNEYKEKTPLSPCNIDLLDSQIREVEKILYTNCSEHCDANCFQSIVQWTSSSCVERCGLEKTLSLCDEPLNEVCKLFQNVFEACPNTCYDGEGCPVGYPCVAYQCTRLKNGLMIFLMILAIGMLVGSIAGLVFAIRKRFKKKKPTIYM